MNTTGLRFRKDMIASRRTAAIGAANRQRTAVEPTMSADAGLEVLRGAPARVRAALETHRAALDAARRTTENDPELTQQGRDARMSELRGQAHEASAAVATDLRGSVEQATAAVRARAAATRPQPASGVEALMGRQIAWNRVREMLDANVPLDEVIGETLDPETLHALHEELPAYLRIKDIPAEGRAAVLQAVDDQLAHVGGERSYKAHTAAREADEHLALVSPLLDHVDQVAAGRASANDGMVAAIRAEHAARQIAGASGDLAMPGESAGTPGDVA